MYKLFNSVVKVSETTAETQMLHPTGNLGFCLKPTETYLQQ